MGEVLSADQRRKQALEWLNENQITYKMIEHEAAFTTEDLERMEINRIAPIAKNLFLRDKKGTRHFLVTMPDDKSADMKLLAEHMESTRLSFGSAERLADHLGIVSGSVSPLCIQNDPEHTVEVFFDCDIRKMPLIGIHPCDNCATVFVSPQQLEELLQKFGSPIKWITI